MPRRLLLLGGGPQHLQVLAAFAREPLAGAELALLTPDAQLVQPALVPAFVAGRVSAEGCRVDTATLAAAAGATWLRERAVAFDAATRTVTLAGGDTLTADVVSLDEPLRADADTLPGAREHALALHPAARFVALFDGLVALAQERVLDLVVLGSGAEAVELALALDERLGARRGREERVRLALVAGEAGVLPGWPAPVQRWAAAALRHARVAVFREPCGALQAGHAVLASGARLACDAALLATPPRPAGWLPAQAAPGVAVAPPGGPREAAALVRWLRRAVAAAPLPALPTAAPARRWLLGARGDAAWAWGPVLVTGWPLGALRLRLDRRALPPLPATRSAGS
jgi:NADH dehydrogenase FAD-containing subunit